MNQKNLMMWAVIGIGGYIVWSNMKQSSATAPAAATSPGITIDLNKIVSDGINAIPSGGTIAGPHDIQSLMGIG
jgi:hypothetical protein